MANWPDHLLKRTVLCPTCTPSRVPPNQNRSLFSCPPRNFYHRPPVSRHRWDNKTTTFENSIRAGRKIHRFSPLWRIFDRFVTYWKRETHKRKVSVNQQKKMFVVVYFALFIRIYLKKWVNSKWTFHFVVCLPAAIFFYNSQKN